MATKRLTKKDYQVLSEYVKQTEKGVIEPLKKAIMRVYGYKANDPYLPTKIFSRKKNLVSTDKLGELFALAGVDKLTVATKVKELLEAKRPLTFRGQISKDENGEVVTIPDYKIQSEAVKIAVDLLNLSHKNMSEKNLGKGVNNLIVFVEGEQDARKRVEEDEKENEVIRESYTVEE